MLDDSDKTTLLQLARKTLDSFLSNGTTPSCNTPSPKLLEYKGAFVSLHRGKELRGCIGQLYPDQELYKVVQHCTLSAALDDARFLPVDYHELADMSIEISVLTPFRRIHSVDEIEVGKHGLYIVQGRYRGLLLPQVCTQYGWNATQFLEQTCRKAGLPESAWRDSRTAIHTFGAQVFSDTLD
jgi:uncharacterized protein